MDRISPPTGTGPSHGQHGHSRVHINHPHSEAVQADTSLARPEDPHPHLQGIPQGTDPARLLPDAGHRHLRQPRLLCGADTGMIKTEKIYSECK